MANLVLLEQQLRQRRVLAANRTHIHLDNAPYQSGKIGWRAQISYKMYKIKNRKIMGDVIERTPRHHRSRQRQRRQSGCRLATTSATCCFGCKSDTNTP